MAFSLLDGLSCPLCTDIFSDPVLVSCGHSFCHQCINTHWTSSRHRSCPVCQQLILQKSVSNLGLWNACKLYLSEQEMDGILKCQKHGKIFLLFCETDDEVICSECKKHEHRGHKVQSLKLVVRQRKGKIKAALRPAQQTLWSLQNGTAQDDICFKYIQCQAQQTERSIQKEFKKLHQFLRQEEESRISALKEEEEEKKGKMDRNTKVQIWSLSERVREVDDAMQEDNITFLQNYYSIMNRTENKFPDQEHSSETLIDVQKHLGNLRYKVWEKMKDICPFYPMILNPNTAPPDFNVSDDLSSVTSCSYQQNIPNPLSLYKNRMVLGSQGYGEGEYSWEIEVGNSQDWTIGACLGSIEKSTGQPLTPKNGFWGLRRDRDSYKLLTAAMITLKIRRHPEVVRVKLGYDKDTEGRRWRTVSFFDASHNSLLEEFCRVPLGKELFPFVIPEEHSSPLRVVPANIILTVEQKLSFLDRHRYFILTCFCFIMVIFMILSWKNQCRG